MAVKSDQLVGGAKGKAVHIVHTFKDHLWEMGSRSDPPDPVPLNQDSKQQAASATTDRADKDLRAPTPDGEADSLSDKLQEAKISENTSPESIAEETPSAEEAEVDGGNDDANRREVSPQGTYATTYVQNCTDEKIDVSSILRTALLQAVSTTLSTLPPSSFPIPATTFYTSHILPSRPVSLDGVPLNSGTPIDIKHSAYKSLTAFLKLVEKEGLLRLKEVKGRGGGEVLVVVVFPQHQDVLAHKSYRTIGEAEAKREKREEKEQEAAGRPKEIVVTELYKPHHQTVKFFEEAGKVYSPFLYIFSTTNDFLSQG